MSTPASDSIARIETAARGPDRPQAIQLAVDALTRGVAHPLVWTLVAEGLELQGRLPEAFGLLQRATAAAPRDAQAWMHMGRVLFGLGRREAARDALKRGLAIAPRDYRGRIDAGTVNLRLGDLAAAKIHFTRAAEIMPLSAEPLSALAVVAGLARDPAEARAMAMRALGLAPNLISAQIAIARADAAEGLADAAQARLTELLTRTDLADGQRSDAHDLRAECRDTLDRPADAFSDYAARNDILRRIHGPALAAAGEEGFADRAARLAAWFEATPADPWRRSPGPDITGPVASGRHVFLVSFPRSGTTLLEKVLSSHPEVVALEEVDVLGAVGNGLLADDLALGRLAGLTAPQAETLRQAYWRGVGEALSAPIGGRIFVDKLPLHTPALPVIAKLFPDAKILFALRDPRDVVLSCYRRSFRINAAMFEFLTLDGAARYYDAVMRLAVLYRDRLPPPVHEVRHEALVADFEGEVRQVLAFIGAPWSAEVHNFTSQARASTRTPSAPQVARGLNADGVGQWRRYRAELEPVLARLAPWAARFGYPAD